VPSSALLDILSRRTVLSGFAGLAAAAPAALFSSSAVAMGDAKAVDATSSLPDFDFTDPDANVRVMARLAGDITGQRAGHVHYSGRVFGMMPGKPVKPFYGIEGMSSTKTIPIEDGKYRFLFSEFAIYTDLKTGAPLENWENPFTGEVVPVWHQRNGPVNFALSPKMNAFGGFNATEDAPGFRLPW